MRRGERGTLLGTMVHVDKLRCIPWSPIRAGGGPRSRRFEFAIQATFVVRITHHCEIFRSVEAGNEHGIDVTVSFIASELDSRCIVFLHIFVEGTHCLNVFLVCLILRHESSASFLLGLEFNARPGFQRAGGHIWGIGGLDTVGGTYGARVPRAGDLGGLVTTVAS